jgi:hypothetical protein
VRTYQPTLPTSLVPGDYLLWVALETLPGHPLPLAAPASSIAPAAPQHPDRVVLRSIQVR